jgi:surface protein
MFEHCYALETVVGMDKWDTSGAYTFDEMFSGCSSLKELDLSGFNTANARDNYKDLNGSTSHAFETMFNQVTSLEKLIVSDQIVYLGNGNVSESRKLVFPNPATKEGYAAKWQNVDTKETYLAKDIPEGVAATYVPYYEYASQGATIKDALTYLNADSGSTNITSKIANVTFGRNEDYAHIVNSYTGVLADAEQDEPVYAYYVENGAYYDLYFLSDGKIYTPKDSTYLFSGLPELLTINTENLDVSRTEIMFTMFYNSPKLHTLDVSNWDTSNVTTMRAMFSQCASLPYLDVSNWDVRNVQSTAKMFYNCLALHDLVGLGNWQTSSLTECNSMFSSGSSVTFRGSVISSFSKPMLSGPL